VMPVTWATIDTTLPEARNALFDVGNSVVIRLTVFRRYSGLTFVSIDYSFIQWHVTTVGSIRSQLQ